MLRRRILVATDEPAPLDVLLSPTPPALQVVAAAAPDSPNVARPSTFAIFRSLSPDDEPNDAPATATRSSPVVAQALPSLGLALLCDGHVIADWNEAVGFALRPATHTAISCDSKKQCMLDLCIAASRALGGDQATVQAKGCTARSRDRSARRAAAGKKRSSKWGTRRHYSSSSSASPSHNADVLDRETEPALRNAMTTATAIVEPLRPPRHAVLLDDYARSPTSGRRDADETQATDDDEINLLVVAASAHAARTAASRCEQRGGPVYDDGTDDGVRASTYVSTMLPRREQHTQRPQPATALVDSPPPVRVQVNEEYLMEPAGRDVLITESGAILKARLRLAHLPMYGNKQTLVDRLARYYSAQESRPSFAASRASDKGRGSTASLIRDESSGKENIDEMAGGTTCTVEGGLLSPPRAQQSPGFAGSIAMAVRHSINRVSLLFSGRRSGDEAMTH